jgi:uncharacterized membrane protein
MAALTQPAGQLAPPLSSSFPSIARPRLDSIDLVRGLIMVLMALDHTRDFFTNAKFDPLDLQQTNPALFLTRWFTHFCAPNFIFLAGVGAFLATTRGKTKSELSWFLFSRGLWLAFLEVTWVRCLGWAFNFDFHNIGVGVLWAIGWSMVVLAALVYLPLPEIAAFGVALILFHNTLDSITPDQLGPLSWLWHVLHVPGQMHPAPGWNFAVGYVLVPWVGVLAAGYGFGAIFLWDAERRRRWVLRLGIWLTLLFILVRWANTYGNPRPWTPQNNLLLTIFSFIDCHKYPPSLDYILMTIGPALILLSFFESGTPRFLKPFLVFGRVPLFYYLLHLPLIHAMAVIVAWIRHGRAGWLFNSPFSAGGAPPPDAGFGLLGVYVAWICAILILYPICCWFAAFKRRRKDAWLSYL